MSKMDAMRAMREARYEQAMARSAKATAARPAVRSAPSRPTPTRAVAPADDAAGPGPALCGHRSMNGRTCTREHGHAAKNHRYS